jgi:hypothetical protein
MAKKLFWLTMVAAMLPGVAQAEPVGRWYVDTGQGSPTYGFNKGSGLDAISIVCMPGDARVRVLVGTGSPRPRDMVKFIVDGNEWDLFTNDSQEVSAGGSDSGSFAGLWNAMRRGKVLRVRLASGGTATFSLAGAARTLPRQPCGG